MHSEKPYKEKKEKRGKGEKNGKKKRRIERPKFSRPNEVGLAKVPEEDELLDENSMDAGVMPYEKNRLAAMQK